jgi:triacylglycerol lipase
VVATLRAVARHHVFLIPGFFGFDSLGDVAYFAHAKEAMDEWCRRAGVDALVHTVPSLPTASLLQRTTGLLAKMSEVVSEVAAGDGGPALHLVGHSSGGLDARLLVTPDVVLPGPIAADPIAARVRSVVTLATPHHGTPVAAFFSSLLGGQLLRVFSITTSYVLRTGRLPADVLVRLAAFFVRVAAGGTVGESPSLERLHQRILADFGPERRAALQSFADLIARDQDLLPQITPATIDVFNASTQDRPTVRYGCVVTQARRPGLRSFASAGLSPYAHASHALYVCISQLAGQVPVDRSPRHSPAQQAALQRFFGADPGRRANDGIVPTRSQVWGEVLRGVWADHLDVIGHFHHPTHVPPHFDWLTSGSGYTRRDFLATWDAVASFLFRR